MVAPVWNECYALPIKLIINSKTLTIHDEEDWKELQETQAVFDREEALETILST